MQISGGNRQERESLGWSVAVVCMVDRVKDSGSRSWGLNADQPEDDEREDSGRRRSIREIEMGRKGKEREGDMQTIHKGEGKKAERKKKG